MPSILNSDDGVVSGTSGLKTTGGNDGALNIQTNGSNAISISSGQRSTFPTTIGVGGATPSTSGSGISFPATQSASSDANTLDDYEEGTWTPSVTSSSGSLTSFTSAGYYTKCGRMVQITGGFLITSAGTASGSALISNLPFTSFNTTGMGGGNRNAIGSAREDGVQGTVQGFFVDPNATTASVFGNPTVTWTNNYQYTFTVVYFT